MADTTGSGGLSTALVAFLAGGGVSAVVSPLLAARRTHRIGDVERQDLVSRVAQQVAAASEDMLEQQRVTVKDANDRARHAETLVTELRGRVETLERELRWYRERYDPRPEGETP